MNDVANAKWSKVYKVEELGIEHGLSIVMDPFLDDYFFPILPVVGWKVSIKMASNI